MSEKKVFIKERLTIAEKIDLFESYLKDNEKSKKIIATTTYRGYPIGLYMAAIRHDLLANTPQIKRYTEESIKRLKDLGLLDTKIESTKSEKIARLIDFVKNNPILWKSNKTRDTQEVVNHYLEQIGQSKDNEKREQLIQLFDRAKSDYTYLRIRKSKGKLSEEDIELLCKNRVGGVFREKEFINEIVEEYGKENNSKARILRKQLVMDTRKKDTLDYAEYKEKYLQDLIDGNNSFVTQKGAELYIKNFDLSEPDMISRKGYYNGLLQTLCNRKIGVVITDEIKQILDFSIENSDLTSNEKAILKLRYSDNNKLTTFKEIGKILEVTATRADQCFNIALKKYEQLPSIRMLREYLEKTENKREEFIREYFKNNDIFIQADIKELPKEERRRLENIFGNMHLEERMVAKQKSKEDKAKKLEFNNLNLTQNTYKILQKKEIKNMYDLIKMSKEAIIQIRGLGEKKYNELKDFANSKGYCIDQPDYLIKNELMAQCIKDAMEGKDYIAVEEVNPKEEEEKQGTSIDELNLSARCLGRLYKSGINTIEELTQMTVEQIKQKIGDTTYNILQEKFKEKGLEFAEDQVNTEEDKLQMSKGQEGTTEEIENADEETLIEIIKRQQKIIEEQQQEIEELEKKYKTEQNK